jgi:hypothetical protein
MNNRDYNYIIRQELTLLWIPIHYSNLHKLLCNKYPQYKWKITSVLSTLTQDSESLNVWAWIYVYKTWSWYIWWSISDIAEKYIMNSDNKEAKLDDIIKYVKENRYVKKWSIVTMMFQVENKNRFIKLKNKRVWIKGYTYSDEVVHRKH